ncbi:OpgC domain-containing protein [Nocardioides sp.]|uniref:OpgC domain-containing protein n=1 Tax=Nocardioides sp. TaxID=35761 RepID=UPI0035115B98
MTTPPTRLPRVPARLLALLAALAVLMPLALGLAAPPAGAAAGDAGDPSPDPVPALPEAGRPWFGPGLDWSADSAQAYADRLGTTPSLYAQRVHYPVTSQDEEFLRQFAQQAASQGAVAVVSMEPQLALDQLTEADATRFAGILADLHTEYDVYFLVRFAPEMNGTWVIWGQQPRQFKTAFRTVADAVHAATEHAAMVWSPAYGSGYPYGAAYGEVPSAGPRETDLLDTDGDGEVTEADDAYGPYWPGDDAVDWVGLSLYRFGDAPPFGPNTLPDPTEYRDRLEETAGYGTGGVRQPFYERYAEDRDLPMLVETSALFNLQASVGPGDLAIKRAWWEQVFDADSDYPLIRGISWLELTRPEAEIDDDRASWEATRTEELASALRAGLEAGDLTLGAVTRVLDTETNSLATAQGRLPQGEDSGAATGMGWIVFCAAALAVLYLLAGLAGRFVPSWRYPDENASRDRRLDLLRGWIIIAVVVTHTEVNGLWSYLTLNGIGAITGAELFVLLSGIVLGMVYRPAVRRMGEWVTAVTMWRRARKQYVTAVVVVLLVPLLGLIPYVRAEVVSTFTDRGTGENGAAALGQVYDLYPNVERLLDYPPPWYAVRSLLLLEIGPWVFNIMGLFVVLSLLLPLLMVLIKRRLWWALLALSWTAYVVGTITDYHPLNSQFEFVFPLLIWQLPFAHGLVIGWYRREITAALTSRWGKILVGLVVVAYAAVLVWLWVCFREGWSPVFLPDSTYLWLYDNAYIRVFLQPGRLFDLLLMIVVPYAVLTTCWKPIDKAVGWFWTPLGENSLYVFIVHVFFVIAVGSLTFLPVENYWVGTAVHTVVVLLIWAMVRSKFLFKVIPR